MPFKTIKTSYNAGELSEYMAGRTDINKYYNGCSKLINATVLPHGGVTKRPGTKYIATAPNKCNLLPFEFSVDDSLVLEFSNLLTRFYKDGDIVNTGVGTEDISGLDNIVAHWLLNEDDGTTAVDDDGATHDGTISVDAANITADGKVGTGCFDLDGQYDVTVSDHNDFSFTDDADDSAFSIVAWGNVVQEGGIQNILSKWRAESTTKEWRFSLNSQQKLQLHLADTSGNLDANRIAQWKLNDDAATKVVLDDTANNHDMTTETDNTEDLTATGKVNACLNFAGADTAILDADHADFTFVEGVDGTFSISAWVYFTSTGAIQSICSKWQAGVAREWRFYSSVADKLKVTLYDETNNEAISCTADDALSEGWHFVVMTYDGENGSWTAATAADYITLYVDGAAVDSTATNNANYVTMADTATKVTIGSYYNNAGNPDNYWADKIDNVTVFNVVLSASDVAAYYNEGNGTEGSIAYEVSAVTDDAISNGWHMFAATYSAPADETTAADGIILYVDGVAVDSTATNNANYTAMQNGAEEVRIGSQRNAGDSANESFWEDKIDEISIFSDVLTPTEVASLYSTTPYSITSPYSSAEAFDVHYTQSADVMYLAHPDHHPKKLSRLGDTEWTLVNVPFTNGPFLDENTTSTSLVGFARVGGTARSGYYFPAGATGTLTASGTDNEPFNSNMVGALWLIKHTRSDNKDTKTGAGNWAASGHATVSAEIKVKGDFTFNCSGMATANHTTALIERKVGNGDWQSYREFSAASAYSGTEDEDDAYYRVTITGVHADNEFAFVAKDQVNRGIVKITDFTNSTVVTCEVINDVMSDNSTDNAVTTSMWAEGAWSDYRGYPRTVTFFEDRLWWASSTNNPDTLWGSKSGDYENMEFTDEGLDDDAVVFPINDNEVSQIQWMLARQVMAVGAANKEYRFGASNLDEPVTPSDRKATPQTGFGSSKIQPVILNDAIFFFQRQGRKVRAMKFDAITENFAADDATMLAYDMFESVPTNMAVQRVPDSIIWTVRTDGVAPTFTYEPDEEVSGWARQIFGNADDVDTNTGTVESVAVIHGSSEDEVWASVQWTIDSSTVRHVVQFKPRDWGSDIEDAFFVDSGITYDSTATTTITGLGHLEGETVAVFADGEVQDNKTVSSGAITIDSASTVQVGLPYTMKVRSMRLAVPQDNETLQTRIKRVSEVVVRYIRSLLGQVGQEYDGTEYLQDVAATNSDDSQDIDNDVRPAQGGFSEDAYTTIVSSDPVPFTVLSTVTSFEIEERR
jgi:hypothetical protein